MAAPERPRGPRRRRRRGADHPSHLPLLLLAALLLLVLPSQAAAAAASARGVGPFVRRHGQDRRRGLSAEAADANSTLAMTTTLAPCLPLPVHSNCSQVPAALHRNVMSCMHISFQPGGYGQEARTAELTFQVEPARADAAAAAEDEAATAGNGLTMVLLVGSKFYFESQADMYEFLQPRLATALQEAKGYDPTLQGPCIGGRHQDGQDGAITSMGRRQRRRLQQQAEAEAAAAGEAGDAALPTCAQVVDAFNSLDIAGGGAGDGAGGHGDARSFAFLYTCNVTASSSVGDGDDRPSPRSHHMRYDHLQPEDYPFSYFVFINASPALAAAASSAAAAADEEDLDEGGLRGLNQTIKYAAAFSPTYVPGATRLPEPAFAVLLVVVAVFFLVMSRWIANPFLDWCSSTRCGKRCLRVGV